MELICLDCEASGLGPHSYPIEIAWKSTGGNSDNFMIDPSTAADWEYWDEYAEEIHGICRTELVKGGVTIVDACRRLNSALSGQRVICDALEFDRFWISRLFEAADQQREFELVGLDAVLSAEELIQYHFLTKAQLRRHRAMSDVEHIHQALRGVKFDL